MKKFLSVLIVFAICVCALSFSACGSAVPTAWVKFNADGGKVYYSTDMYGINSPHISYYENETDESPVITINFSPRILGPDFNDGERKTTVDISGVYIMYITVYKDNDTYSDTKAFYLNDNALTPDRTNEYTDFISFEFEDFGLTRGNPNGRINGVVNVIEYK